MRIHQLQLHAPMKSRQDQIERETIGRHHLRFGLDSAAIAAPKSLVEEDHLAAAWRYAVAALRWEVRCPRSLPSQARALEGALT